MSATDLFANDRRVTLLILIASKMPEISYMRYPSVFTDNYSLLFSFLFKLISVIVWIFVQRMRKILAKDQLM